jgi:hypothetical protein
MEHVSESLNAILAEVRQNRDNEVSMAAEVLPQYVTDHHDKDAFRSIDRQVATLARSWDKMIALLERTVLSARRIEDAPENFYGD